MKNLTSFFFLLAFTAMAFVSNAQNDDKSFVKTLNPGVSNTIVMDVKFPVNGKQWEESSMRVLLYVSLENANESVLKQLVQLGRYNVEGRVEGDKYIVDVPALSKEVTIKGAKLIETVKAEIYVPGGILVANVEGETIQVESERFKQLQSAGLAMKGAPIFKPFDCEVNFTTQQSSEAISPDDIMIDGQKLSALPKN